MEARVQVARTESEGLQHLHWEDNDQLYLTSHTQINRTTSLQILVQLLLLPQVVVVVKPVLGPQSDLERLIPTMMNPSHLLPSPLRQYNNNIINP